MSCHTRGAPHENTDEGRRVSIPHRAGWAGKQFGDERFQDIARTVRRNATIDWHLREQARANLRRMVKGCCAGTGTRRTGRSMRAAP
ncbi:type I restriction enzyme endonuclease domain-containing protein [Deinococcus aquiradiocola]|uniref:type I restriction enzyme endonuclease domain-containing protein n=1 Tax=Deinococcus aquiradiocola TaxID=393059 RepID=UPI0035717736